MSNEPIAEPCPTLIVMNSPIRLLVTVVVPAFLFASAAVGQGVELDFAGYRPHESVVGQGGPRGPVWQKVFGPDPAGLGILVAEERGRRFMVTRPADNGSINLGVTWEPTATELGGPGFRFDPGASVVRAAFTVSYGRVGNFDGSNTRIYLGGYDGQIARLTFQSNGRIDFSHGETTDANENPWLRVDLTGNGQGDNAIADQPLRFEIEANFATKTYTLTVNGVRQRVARSFDIPFHRPGADNVGFHFANVQSTSPQFNAIRLHALRMSAGR